MEPRIFAIRPKFQDGRRYEIRSRLDLDLDGGRHFESMGAAILDRTM